MKENYFLVDALKLFFSLCVVALHTNLFLDKWPTVYWYASHCFWRIAVPFFFITSGYFFCKKIKTLPEPNKVLKKTLKRLSILFFFWLIITLPLEINSLVIQKFTPLQIILELVKKVFCYPWGALWYISSLMVGYLLIYPFLKRKKYKLPLIIGSILFLFATVSNSYYFLIENTFLQKIVDEYLKLFISSRNGIFVGFFYVAIANYLTENASFSKKKNLLLFIIGIIGLFFEAYFIRSRHYVEDHSLFFSLLLIAPTLFHLAKSFKISIDSTTIRNLSIGIYVLHRPILGYLNYFCQIEQRINSIQLFTLISILAIIISYLLQKINNRYINKIIT